MTEIPDEIWERIRQLGIKCGAGKTHRTIADALEAKIKKLDDENWELSEELALVYAKIRNGDEVELPPIAIAG